MSEVTDVPAGLQLVQPDTSTGQWRVVLWSASGEGKTVAATSAPGPILAVNADRPGAYRYARRHHPDKDIRETRFDGMQTLADTYRYLRDNPDVATLILDPFQNIYDKLIDQSPKRGDGDPDYTGVNKKLLGFLYSLRDFDIHVVIVAHEKPSDGKKGDGKLYPSLGGPALINKVLAEMDIVAHVEREAPQGDSPARYMAQLTPVRNLVGKESTGVLGERRELDLSEWFDVVAEGLAPDNSDLPWEGDLKADKTLDEELADGETLEEALADGTDGLEAAA